MSVFGAAYASAYDVVYADKDYEAECDVLEQRFHRLASRTVASVLDLGCGTGRHAAALSARGYAVVGVDRSPDMLALARRNVGGVATFVEGDITSVDLGRRFDAVLMMFAVLGYLTPDDDIAAALTTARRHLRRGGVFLFDVWYAPAVVAMRPSERVRQIDLPEGRVVRRASGTLDERRCLCTVRIHLVDERGGRLQEIDEEHVVRYFDRSELERLLAAAGFELVGLTGFPNLEREPDESTWSVLAAARSA